MKKTQWIDLWTTIRKNRVPYIAIILFVALGISLFAGMSWTYTFISDSMTATYADGRLAQLRVLYPYGASEEQIDELLAVDGIDDAEGYNSVYRFFELNGTRQQAIIYQLTERIDSCTLVSGVMPEAENEIAVLRSWAEDYNVAVGDTITFIEDYGTDYRELRPVTALAGWDPDSGEEPDTDTSDPGYLKTDTFTVTALVESPEYLMGMKAGYGSNAVNGVSVDGIMFVSEAAMDPGLFNGYTNVVLYSSTLAELDGTDGYDPASDELKTAVAAVTDTWTAVPDAYNSAVDSVGQTLSDASEQLSDAQQTIDEKQTELDEGRQEINDAEETLAEKQSEYDAGKAEYDEKAAEYEAAEAEYSEKLAEYNAGQSEYSAKLSETNSAAARLTTGWNAYDTLMQDISAADTLRGDIASFLQILSETRNAGKTPSEDTPSEDTPSEDTPSDGGDAGETDDADERLESAVAAVRADASALYDLVSGQEEEISYLTDYADAASTLSGLTSAAAQLMNCTTAEEMKAAIDSCSSELSGIISSVSGLPDDLYSMLSSSQGLLNSAYAQLAEAAAQLEDALAQLTDGRAQLDAAAAQLAEAAAQLENGLAQLTDGRAQLDDAAAQLDEGERALEDARTELAEKQSEYEDSLGIYEELNKASDSVYDVKAAIFTRSANLSVASSEGVAEVIYKARSILASVFLIVAACVGYSTLSRMVADTTKQIGTKKALGFTRREILRMYLLYAFSATLIGGLLGVGGAYGVEAVFRYVYTGIYYLIDFPPVLRAEDVLLPLAFETVLLILSAILAVLSRVNRKAIDLLNGNTDTGNNAKHGRESFLTRRLPLLDRIILANLRQDRRRVIAMLTGIGGAAMLLTSGLTCWLNMGRSLDLEYSNYFRFDTVIRYDPSDETASGRLRELLDSYGVSYAEVFQTHMLTDDGSGLTRLPDVIAAADLQELENVMTFTDSNGKNVEFTGGLWIADSYSEKQGFKVGDVIELQTLSGETAELPAAGYFRNYLSTLIMVTDLETWQSVFTDAEPNAFLVNTAGIDAAALHSDLTETDGYICSIPFKDDTVSTFSSVMIIITVSAGTFSVMAVLLMAMLLINLMDMYIGEKKRELIILKINGYPERKVRRYIWQDTLLLTIAGIIIGTVLGTVQGNLTQSAWEGTIMLLYHGISWIAVAAAAGITALLAFVITLAELKKIDAFRLSDINN